jgi:ABC-type transporter Mla maintaining outer membrane lipid asymmetry ATPase subunit MlaF
MKAGEGTANDGVKEKIVKSNRWKEEGWKSVKGDVGVGQGTQMVGGSGNGKSSSDQLR